MHDTNQKVTWRFHNQLIPDLRLIPQFKRYVTKLPTVEKFNILLLANKS